MIPTMRNVTLHPIYCPTSLPSGSPAIVAMDVPVTPMLSATGEAIDQNIAWVHATPIRDAMSTPYVGAITDMIWHIPNSAIVPMNSFLKSIFDTRSMSGRDNSMTIHEYTVISIPAFDSDMLNDFAMSVSKPIGINSDVLNMNAETVIPTSGSISFLVNLLFIFIPLPNNMWYI